MEKQNHNMKYLKSYKIFESNNIKDIKSDIKHILIDISDDDYWEVLIFYYKKSWIISLETSFDEDFIKLPEYSKEAIKRLISYMNINGFNNYKIKKESNIIILGGKDIHESEDIKIEDVENVELIQGKQILIEFWE